MHKDSAKLQRAPHQSAQLRSINGQIARLSAVKPYTDIRGTFAFAARLAGDAIAAAEEIQKMPGDAETFQPTLEFWHRVRDYNYAAALACGGGNQTLAEATVALLFLQTSCARKPAGVEALDQMNQERWWASDQEDSVPKVPAWFLERGACASIPALHEQRRSNDRRVRAMPTKMSEYARFILSFRCPICRRGPGHYCRNEQGKCVPPHSEWRQEALGACYAPLRRVA